MNYKATLPIVLLTLSAMVLTAWLMPERLNREEVGYYLKACQEAEYNMEQVLLYYKNNVL